MTPPIKHSTDDVLFESFRNGCFAFTVQDQSYSKDEHFWRFAGLQISHVSDLNRRLSHVKSGGYVLFSLVSVVFILTSLGLFWYHPLYSAIALILLGLLSFIASRRITLFSREIIEFFGSDIPEQSIAGNFSRKGELVLYAARVFPDETRRHLGPEFDWESALSGQLSYRSTIWIVLSIISCGLAATLFWGIIMERNMWFNWLGRLIFY